EAGLGKLASLESGVVAPRSWIGVIGDPFSVVSAQFSQVVIPVRPEAHGIADKCAHDGASCAVLYGCFRHVGLLCLIRSGDRRLFSYGRVTWNISSMRKG